MICSSCGAENRDTAKFCLGCGQSLTLVCSGCGAELPPTARFCDQCGTALQVAGSSTQVSAPDTHHPAPDPRSYTPKHLAAKILTARSALEGERKQVTRAVRRRQRLHRTERRPRPRGGPRHHGPLLPDLER